MPVATIDVLDKDSVARTVNALPSLGSVADASSLPVTKSTEDKAVSSAIKTAVEGMAAGTSTVSVKTSMKTVSVEFTRPSDTTAYAANDVVGNTGAAAVINFADMFAANAGTGYLVKARLLTDQAANVAAHRLYIYHTTPTPIADNSAFTLLYADESKLVGYIDFPAGQTEGTGSTASIAQWTGQLQANAAAADVDFYCVLITKTIYTPANAQKYTISLSVDRN